MPNGALVNEVAPTKKDLLANLRAENESLRASLGIAIPTEYETWAANVPQHIRDQMAVRALFAEWMDEPKALIRLGFDCARRPNTSWWMPEVHALAKKIFGTPGVQAILEADNAEAEDHRLKIISRLIQIAEHGEDKIAVAAASQIANVSGWKKSTLNINGGAAPTFNLFQMMATAQGKDGMKRAGQTAFADPNATIDAADFLDHEPGEAILVADKDEDPVK